MIATAFFGYVLPWGQMSYWAATVITSSLSSIPIIGSDLLISVWGNNSVGQSTLSRIYSFHFILPFVILGSVISHLFLLHEHGSNNPLGVVSYDNIPFHPYYTRKDILGVMVANIGFFFSYFLYPIFYHIRIIIFQLTRLLLLHISFLNGTFYHFMVSLVLFQIKSVVFCYQF